LFPAAPRLAFGKGGCLPPARGRVSSKEGKALAGYLFSDENIDFVLEPADRQGP
jgi:hypothetical protein